jgi:hypothetical protein
LRNRIVNALRSSSDSAARLASSKVQNGVVYTNPTVALLASAVAALVDPASTGTSSSAIQDVESMIQKYSRDMPSMIPEAMSATKPESAVVLLTGSTGGLGSQLLAACLANEHVQRIYVLNRPSARATSEERHRTTFVDRGLDIGLLASPKLVYLEGEASKDWLGLRQELYDEVRGYFTTLTLGADVPCAQIRKNVTTIIHNAWRLDFNLSLLSFEPNVRGVRNLLDLALTSPQANHVRVLFTSSIAVTGRWPRERGAFPEEPMSDPSFAIGQGYGEGKYVGERVRSGLVCFKPVMLTRQCSYS